MVQPLYTDRELSRLHPPGDQNDFVVIERPVFKPHEMRSGKKVGKRELERTIHRNNNRLNTGDWCPLVIHHTKDDGSSDPEIIGFAGPFRLGEIGDKVKEPAIIAKQWVFKDKYDKFKDHPRQSVEFWQDKEDPGCGFFDPIACLGATTPELDLGVHYEKSAENTLVRYHKAEQYEAAFPGGGGPNTAIPGMDEKKPKQYSAGDPLPEQAVMQLVQALTPIIEAKITEMSAGLKKAIAAVTMAQEADDDEVDTELAGEPGAGQGPPGMEPAAPPLPAMPPEPPAGPAPAQPQEKKDMEPNADAVKYQKERDDLQVKYSKLQGEHTALQTENGTLKAELATVAREKQKAVRYSKLKEKLDAGFQFDLDDETGYVADMDDAAFAKHLTRVEKYQRVPQGMLPGIEKPIRQDGLPDQERSEKYAKVATDACRKLNLPHQQYGEVLANVTKNHGRYVAA